VGTIITVNATGTVAIAGGTFNANGNMTLNGQMTCDATGTFTVAAGKTLTIQSGGNATFTGDHTIDTASTIAITGGTFTANGNMTLNGQLTRDAAGTFTVAAGKTLTVQNGGDAIFTGSYTTTGSNITVTGAGSTFTTTSNLDINGSNAMNLTSGGAVSSGSGQRNHRPFWAMGRPPWMAADRASAAGHSQSGEPAIPAALPSAIAVRVDSCWSEWATPTFRAVAERSPFRTAPQSPERPWIWLARVWFLGAALEP